MLRADHSSTVPLPGVDWLLEAYRVLTAADYAQYILRAREEAYLPYCADIAVKLAGKRADIDAVEAAYAKHTETLRDRHKLDSALSPERRRKAFAEYTADMSEPLSARRRNLTAITAAYSETVAPYRRVYSNRLAELLSGFTEYGV
jgi:Skp family chaperone for outer membrane proteins